ncbi:hypothetical protein [Parapusillimonas granuli]|uniref:Uncharacterized protein n=1 Tax=Parapusillimonas granuli TaxID=380911 RepID=A0A853FZQ1_9BURK|nr:hypothetical protein [Parapusillimonas granuli]MBB5216772.1 hypothetical protein [Parapusillimonas granuli]MEB2400101.1 hypothetical protein [Alcaligenaceae bacterium]NYT51584.1 hypothetical protein [Parapusillimonas granuli]
MAAALGRAQPAEAALTLEGAGRWAIRQGGGARPLRLLRAWPAFAWVTLRFQDDAAGARGKPLELTIWKAGLEEEQWRELRRCVAAQHAMPERSHNKEKP